METSIRIRGHRTLVGLLLAFALAGCQATATPSPVPSAPASTAIPQASATSDELAAIHFRTSAGLRADLAYVRSVALDPRASAKEFSVPLLPDEIAELLARSENADAVSEVIQAEADKHPDDYCGMYIDQLHGGAVTSLWRAGLTFREAAIRARISPRARVAFGTCLFSLRDLAQLAARIAADSAWFEALPAHVSGVGADQKANAVNIDVSTTLPDIAVRIATRYGVPLSMLQVTSDGTGAHFVPWGTVDVTIIGPDGVLRDASLADLLPGWSSTVNGLRCGHGDVGVGFTALPCQAGTWTISVNARVGDGDWFSIGQGSVVVHANQTSKLTIRVGPLPTAAPNG